MSNSNIFNGGNFQQTPLDVAYKFSSFSQYINNNNSLSSIFSPRCIFCSSNQSKPLTNDGSFRHCSNCKKQFKALLSRN
jgi:hypothetical protein